MALELAKAEDGLKSTDQDYLGLVLNVSVFYYEHMKKKKKAISLCKEAFDQALSDLEEIKEEEYKDVTMVMQVIRDNITLWSSNEED